MEILTHFKKTFNPKYLGSWSLPNGQDLIATIDHVLEEEVTSDGVRKDKRNIVYFKEALKPMVLNVTNSQTISRIAKTPYVENWGGIQIQIFVTQIQDRRTKISIDALRIREKPPELNVNQALEKLKSSKSIGDLQNAWTSLSRLEQSSPIVVRLKEQLKGELK